MSLVNQKRLYLIIYYIKEAIMFRVIKGLLLEEISFILEED
jgi:hypothetical protein